MKLFFCFPLFGFFVVRFLFVRAVSVTSLKLSSKDFSKPVDAIFVIINHLYDSHDVTTTNLISPESLNHIDLNDFKDELFAKCSANSNLLFRQDSTMHIVSIAGRRKRFSVILISTFEGFLQTYERIKPEYFWFNGFYLIVLANGEFAEVETIFKLLWTNQIYNADILLEDENGKVLIKTFFPFRAASCDDTTPMTINQFIDGKFVNSANFFPNKMDNLQGCPIKASVSNNSEPAVFAQKLSNGSDDLSGRDIELVHTLAETLNFKIEFSFVGEEGYLLENGTSVGPLRALLDGKADVSISDWWLKGNRLKFFDSSIAYTSDQVIFVVPPGKDLTTFEKLVFPFSNSTWCAMLICFLVGFFIIFIIKRQTRRVQNFVFGAGVRNPFLNLFIGFIGGTQKILPPTNFARFLLTMFLMYSLVIRTLYQGSYYRLIQSNRHQNEIESIDEIIRKDFKIYVIRGITDVVQGSAALKRRLV